METEPQVAAAVAPALSNADRPEVARHRCWPDWLAMVLVVLIAAGALAFRLEQLERRPFHLDEGVQAVKTGELYDGGEYRYDPVEFHGPSLYYFTLPILKLSGAKSFADAKDVHFRLVPVLCGVALILLLLPLRRGLGGVAIWTAAGLLAVSPAMVFYSRYYIQEMMLVMFAGLALGALWRLDRTWRWGWAVLLGLAIGLLVATKETSVICCGSLAVAYAWLVVRRQAASGPRRWRLPVRQCRLLLLAGGVAVVVAGLFYASFGDHPRGPLDFLLAFRHYFDRSGGVGSAAMHQQPWHYYLKLLAYTKDAPGPWWSEGLILILAVVGLVASMFGTLAQPARFTADSEGFANHGGGQDARATGGPGILPETSRCPPMTEGHRASRAFAVIHPELAGFLAVYTVCMTVAYALIPYKTPWNLLGFLHGLILMAGIGVSVVYHWLPWRCGRAAWLVLVLAGTAQLAAQAARASFRFCADSRNPYVYAHSGPDVVRLAQRIDEVAALHPDGRAMRIHFITPDYWPMPYYLRKFSRVGYWHEIPATPDAPVIVASVDLQEQLAPLLRDSYHTAFYGLRPDVLLVLNIRQDLWERYMEMKSDSSEKSR